ncbi:phospholipase C, phosphocholine-specific [Streptomyces oryzae]|uniref:phospholipase C n=1 Tax=Streptomyces oryzae TaxID=1434886 RepID=A0ABS3X7L3_9ACTN|nr:phospholipase C, phosphocholine-specific [Streptomyces oryzae]MBO8191351.1 phospholipase C, phosphocholine-specific [Streptomyces oryzae]
MSTSLSRRRALALGAGALGASAAASLLPPSLQRALAAEPLSGGLDTVKHVVILMQENRSFDHYFGMLRGVRGFADRNAVELPNGGPVYRQPDGRKHVLPFPVRAAAEAQEKDLQYIGALNHDWDGGQKAWNGGWMNQWIAAKTPATMAYYDRADIPLQYELADTFTVCDAYHSSMHTSTSPNRNYLWSGNSGNEADGKRAIGNDAYDEGTHPGYTWATYAELLEKAGRSWQTYTEWENFTDNQIEFFATFKAVARKALAKTGGHTYMESFYAVVRDTSDAAERKRLLGLLDEGVATLSPAERSLFDRALRRVATGTLAEAFSRDVAAGKLPEVSYIVPSAVDSEHPSVSSPIHSASIVYKVLDALASHPEVWQHTVVLINYDENDGFFDHVPPPVPPADDPDEWWKGKPTGLGIRVPLLVVSPWTVGGYVCSEVFDHTSVNRFLERWTGIEDPNITPWRRRVCGDLTSAFDFTDSQAQPTVQQPGPIPPFTGRWQPEPPADQRMPEPEPGTRPARPLPYQPEAHATVTDGKVTVALTNTGKSGVHFALYPYAGEFKTPQHQDVTDSGRWTVPVSGDRYRFTVTGPNGFRREFAGGVKAPGAEVRSAVDAGTRELRLTLRNRSASALTFTLRPQGYVSEADATRLTQQIRVAPGAEATAVHPAARTHGWYDLAVTVDGDSAFHRRLMGHIENGHASVSG